MTCLWLGNPVQSKHRIEMFDGDVLKCLCFEFITSGILSLKTFCSMWIFFGNRWVFYLERIAFSGLFCPFRKTQKRMVESKETMVEKVRIGVEEIFSSVCLLSNLTCFCWQRMSDGALEQRWTPRKLSWERKRRYWNGTHIWYLCALLVWSKDILRIDSAHFWYSCLRNKLW